MTIVIASFTKGNGLDFEVTTNASGKLFISLGATTARTSTVNVNGSHCYQITDAEFLANFKKISGLNPKKSLNLTDPSTATAEKQAAEIAKQAQRSSNNNHYAKLENDTKIEFEVSYYHGAYVTANTPESDEIAELNTLMARNDTHVNQVFSQFGEVVSTWDGTRYVATKEQIASIIVAFKNIENGIEEKEVEKEIEEKAHFEATLAIAIETNKPQVLAQRMESCDKSVHDCSQDIVYKLLDKDGQITYQRVHMH